MKRRSPYAVPCVVALLLCSLAGSLWSEEHQPQSPSLTLEEYQATLQRWSAEVAKLSSDSSVAAKLRASLPKTMQVRTPSGTIESSTYWLDASLETFQKTKPAQRSDLIKKIQQRLEATQQESREFLEPSPAEGGRRDKLQSILARREFRAVRGPDAWDLLMERVQRWIFRLLDKIFSGVAAPAQAGQLLVWIVITVASCVLAIWLKRRLTHAPHDVRREPLRFATPSSKSSRKWLAEAQAAAIDGRWRDAIHLGYWAGVARLEESGAWIPDRARTPREYLRLLSPRSQDRPALAALTQKFEIVWYGNRDAGASDFQHVVTQLERLQCRL